MANFDATSAAPFNNTVAATLNLLSSTPESLSLRVTALTGDKAESTLKLNGSFTDAGQIRYLTSATSTEAAGTFVVSFSLYVPPETLDFSAGLRSDRLWANVLAGDDWFVLGSGSDQVKLHGGDDYVNGGGGNDRIEGGAGNDVIDGGTGVDQAVYGQARSAYTLGRSGDAFQVTHGAGEEGTDALRNVERLVFSDANVAIDFSGAAGSTATILGALFGPSTVSNKSMVGIGLQLFDSGLGAMDVAQLGVSHVFGSGYTHAALVDTLWRNLMGGAPSAADAAVYVGALQRGEFTPASLLLAAANHPLNAANIGLVGLTATGIEYT